MRALPWPRRPPKTSPASRCRPPSRSAPTARCALRTGEIGFPVAKLFTLCDDRERILAVLARVRGGGWSEHQIKALLPQMNKETDRRLCFVGIAAYQAAGGVIVRDLFGDEAFATDGDLLDRLFAERLTAGAETLRSTEGWKWARVETQPHFDYATREAFERAYPQEQELPDAEQAEYDALALAMEEGAGLTEAQAARLDALEAKLASIYTPEQTSLAGILVRVTYQGEIAVERGFVTEEDVAEAIPCGVLDLRSEPTRTSRDKGQASPYSGALTQDMKAVRLAAVQTPLLAEAELVLDLLAFGLSQTSRATCSVFGLRPERPNNQPVADAGSPPTRGWRVRRRRRRLGAFRSCASRPRR